MGASRGAGTNLFRFLSDVQSRGADEALHALNLSGLAGRPIQEIFLELVDYICPDGGTLDEAIAREAFIETIVELADLGVTDLDALAPDQLMSVFELYVTNAIEGRLCNDIALKLIQVPTNVDAANNVQDQLHDFIQRGVADALANVSLENQDLTPNRVLEVVTSIYECSFTVLKAMGDQEASQ